MHNDKIDPALRARVLEQEAAKRGIKAPAHVRVGMYEEEAARRGLLVYPTFNSFVQSRKPELLEHEYMRRQVSVAERVLAGLILRLIVLLPTQYGKSEIWSRLLPAYYLLSHPSRRVMLSSYGAELAWELSSDARDNYEAAGGSFREGSIRGSMRNWRTKRIGGASGGMWATGIGGPQLGRGYNLGIVDDPIDPEQAKRGPYLRKFARWWPSKWLRGARPAGTHGSASPIVFVMQRLGIEDPVNWLLEREDGPAQEGWHILCMDELHSDQPYGRWKGPMGFPKSCTLEPDFRKPGEVLAPKFRTPAEVTAIQAKSGPVVTGAMRQQRPMQPTGDFWALKWFEDRVYDRLPPDAHNGGWDWDTAYTKDETNSATAGVYSYCGVGGKDECRIYVEDFSVEYWEFPELVNGLRAKKGPHYVEQKASGKSAVQQLKAYNVAAEEVKVLGDKLSRASAAQPAASNHRIYFNRLVYERLLFGEQGLLRITAEALQEGGEGLDLNDAFVQAIWRHLDIANSKKRVLFG